MAVKRRSSRRTGGERRPSRTRRSKKSRRSKRNGASIGYTVLTVVLLAAVVFLALGILDVFTPPPSRAEELTVLVLNGCGVEGIGQRAARRLRELGLDVVDFRNADSFGYAESIVVDRTGDLPAAAGVAKLLGASNVIQQVPETPLVDVILIVGADYEEYLPK